MRLDKHGGRPLLPGRTGTEMRGCGDGLTEILGNAEERCEDWKRQMGWGYVGDRDSTETRDSGIETKTEI